MSSRYHTWKTGNGSWKRNVEVEVGCVGGEWSVARVRFLMKTSGE